MRTINGFFLFELGQIWLLANLAPGTDIQPNLSSIGHRLYILGLFVNNPDNQNDLPSSVYEANQLINYLEAMIQRSTEKVTETDQMTILHILVRFRTLLNDELGKAFTFVVEEKRGFNTATLWSRPLKLFSSDIIPLLSDFVKTNLDEAAKCLLLDRYTAVGFHAMRSVECVARRYYELITGNSPPYTDKNGKEYFKMLGTIAQELADKYGSLQRQKSTSGNLGVIAPLLKALCKIYRDPLSHPEIQKLDEGQAITTFNQAIEVISMIAVDAKTSGPHFTKAWASGWLF